MNKYRVAIAGLGSAAKNIHIPALRKIPQVRIIGAFDPRQEINDFPQFKTLEQLMEAQPDIVVIATPPDAHAPVAVAALKSGAHVFCEKPLANSLSEADEIAAASARADRKVCINSEFPFMPMHLAALREVGSARFGQLLFLEARQTFVVTEATEAGWRGQDPQRTFKEFGTHVIDLCKVLFGEQPVSISARMPRPLTGAGPDYLNLIRREFSGDRVAQITLDRLTRGSHRYLDMRLVGEKATIETSVGGSAELSIGLRAQGRKPYADLKFHFGGIARLYTGERHVTLAKAPIDLFPDATARLFRAFLQAIEEDREPPNGIVDARNTLELIYRAYGGECPERP